jgi:hypothetical protein
MLHSFCLTVKHNFMVFAAAQRIRNLNHPHIEHATGHWHRLTRCQWSAFFLISISSKVRKSNPPMEPHGRTFHPQKGCRTVLDGLGAGAGAGVFSVRESPIKILAVGESNGSFCGIKKNCGGTTSLINRSMNKHPLLCHFS